MLSWRGDRQPRPLPGQSRLLSSLRLPIDGSARVPVYRKHQGIPGVGGRGFRGEDHPLFPSRTCLDLHSIWKTQGAGIRDLERQWPTALLLLRTIGSRHNYCSGSALRTSAEVEFFLLIEQLTVQQHLDDATSREYDVRTAS